MNKIALNSAVLNILRVYATALVFFCHSTIVARECFGFSLHGLKRLINTPAWGGVWMFLAIGGFLAAYGFDQHKYALDKNGILKYYKGRVLKILIPTYIFLSLMYIFNMQEAQVKWITILKWLTCTFNGPGAGIQRVGASWYVFIMMWLYFLTPIVLKLFFKFENKHRGNELIWYFKCLILIFVIGILYRAVGVFYNRFDDQFYYNWCYANVTGTIDMFLVGIIGERMIHYLPEINENKIRKYRKYSFLLLIFTTCFFLGNVKYQTTIYKIIGPIMFSVSTILIITIYSYKYKCKVIKSYITETKLAAFCNIVAPYTFMFYLWHSPLLGYVAEKLEIRGNDSHYFVMLTLGGIVTAYIAFLMTKMNNDTIKTILKK